MWDQQSGERVRIIAGYGGAYTIAWGLSRDVLISGGSDGKLYWWDVQSRECMRVRRAHQGTIRSLRRSPDGSRLASCGDDGTIILWDLESGQSTRTLEGHTGWVTAVAISPNGERAVTASVDETLRVWNLDSGESPYMLQGHTDRVNAVAITPDGRWAISASADHTLRVWNLDSGEYSAGFTGEGPISCLAVGKDGQTIIANEKSGRGHFLRLDGVD